eukprot:1261526-Pyramimonas_sp.AAC.1
MTAQEGPNTAPRGPQRPPLEGPRDHREVLQECRRCPQQLFEMFERCWNLLLLGIPAAHDGPRDPQDRPKIAHE